MKNSKGFTLVEVLAAVVILGILMGVGIPAVTKHLNRSKEESYDVMITSIYDGTMAYIMDRNEYPVGGTPKTINIGDLENAGYVESLADPGSSEKCDGVVVVSLISVGDTSKLPEYKYEINLICPSKTINKTINS